MALQVETMEPRELLSGLTPALSTETNAVPRHILPFAESYYPFAKGKSFSVRFNEGPNLTAKIELGTQKIFLPDGRLTAWRLTETISDAPKGGQVLDLYFHLQGINTLEFERLNRFQIGPVGNPNPIKLTQSVKFEQAFLYFTRFGDPVPTTKNVGSQIFDLTVGRDPIKDFRVFNQTITNNRGESLNFDSFKLTTYYADLRALGIAASRENPVNGIHFDIYVIPA